MHAAACALPPPARRHWRRRPPAPSDDTQHNPLYLPGPRPTCRMGGSMRRHRKHKPRIIKRHSKKKHTKSEAPQELVVNAAEIKERTGVE